MQGSSHKHTAVNGLIVPIEASDIVDGKSYLIAMRPTLSQPYYRFQARDTKGRIIWSRAPAKAMRFKGCKGLRQAMTKSASLVAVADLPTSNRP